MVDSMALAWVGTGVPGSSCWLNMDRDVETTLWCEIGGQRYAYGRWRYSGETMTMEMDPKVRQ